MNSYKTRITPSKQIAMMLSTSLVALTCPLGSYSQEAPEGEIFELSPFEVVSTDEGGYFVNDTLAGSRLRSDVKDLSASITQLSDDFVNDLGASDLSELLAYMPSAEQEHTTENAQDFAGAFRAQRYRVRGLFTEGIARNYFTGIDGEYMPPSDTYNVGRTTLSAGANSILFGSANPAGIVNSSTVVPEFKKDSYGIKHRTDNYGTFRVELDANKILIEDKLAIRLALLHEEREMWLDPQWKDQERFYGAIKWRISDRTTLSGNMEYMDFARNAPPPVVLSDRSDLWRSEGSPLVNITGTGNVTGPVPGASNYGAARYPNAVLGSADPQVPVFQSWRFRAIGASNRVGVNNSLNQPVPFDLIDLEKNYLADFRIDDRHAWIGDFSLEHKFTDNLYAQFSMFQFEHRKDVFIGMNPNIFADASSNLAILPGGGATTAANSNAGRYYLDSTRALGQQFFYDATNYRGTVSYDLDLIERNKLLGRHQFAFMIENNVGNRYTAIRDLMNTDPATLANPSPLSTLNRVRNILYIDLEEGPIFPEGQPSDIRNLQPYLVEQGMTGAEWVRRQPGVSVETTQKAYLGAVQSHWFDGRFVTTAGYRIDQQDVMEVAASDWATDDRGYFVDARAAGPRTRNEDTSDIEEDTYSMGAVYHLVRDKGPVSLFSLTYNQSTNFAPSTSLRDLFGDTLPYSTGETEDIGFKLQMFDGKLNARLSHFESGQLNARQGSTEIFLVANPVRAIWEGLAEALNDTSFEDMVPLNQTDTYDIAAKGYEFELTYNPVSNWRTRITASQNESVRSNINPIGGRYIAANEDVWRSQYGSVVINDATGETVNEKVDELKELYAGLKAREGEKSVEQREWAFSLLSSYDFTEGTLKGFGVGATMVWQDEAAIGYAEAANGIIDPNVPFYGEDNLDLGLNLKYRKKFDSFDWTIQLNVRNLLDESDPLAVRAIEAASAINEPFYTHYRLKEPRSFTLTNEFKF